MQDALHSNPFGDRKKDPLNQSAPATTGLNATSLCCVDRQQHGMMSCAVDQARPLANGSGWLNKPGKRGQRISRGPTCAQQSKENTLLRVVPTMACQDNIFDIYSGILPNILYDIDSDMLLGILPDIIFDFLPGSLFDIYYDIECGILSQIFRHLFWHSI